MASNDRLHQIIRSLTPSEKRSFKVFARRHREGAKNKYVELFDLLARQDEYDEQAIHAQFKNTLFINRLSYEKNHLRQLVFRAMRGYKEHDTSEAKIKYILEDAAFLRRKGLYDQEERLLAKAYLLAQTHEKFHESLKILDLQRQLVVVNRVGLHEKMDDNQSRRKEILTQLANFYRYQENADALFIYVRGNYRIQDKQKRKEIESYVSEKWMQSEDQAITWRAKIAYLKSWSYYHQLTGNPHQLLAIQERVRELWISQPQFVKDELIEYIIVLANLSNAALNCQNWTRLEQLLDEMNYLKTSTYDEKAEFAKNYLFFKLLLFMNTERLGKALSLVGKIEEVLEKFESQFNRARLLAVYYNVTMLHLATQKYEEGLRWSRKILDSTKTDHRQDIKTRVQFLQLIFHYEFNNLQFISDSLLRSIKRSLEYAGRKNEGETLILHTFRELADNPLSQSVPIFVELGRQLREFPGTLCYSEFMLYLDHKSK